MTEFLSSWVGMWLACDRCSQSEASRDLVYKDSFSKYALSPEEAGFISKTHGAIYHTHGISLIDYCDLTLFCLHGYFLELGFYLVTSGKVFVFIDVLFFFLLMYGCIALCSNIWLLHTQVKHWLYLSWLLHLDWNLDVPIL